MSEKEEGQGSGLPSLLIHISRNFSPRYPHTVKPQWQGVMSCCSLMWF